MLWTTASFSSSPASSDEQAAILKLPNSIAAAMSRIRHDKRALNVGMGNIAESPLKYTVQLA
jgi:hypothetical protein